MQEYHFTLSFDISASTRGTNDLVEALGRAGCHDAIVGTGKKCRIAVSFDRGAEDARAALHSALHDVRKAIPEGTLIEANPDLVDVTDVAHMVGRTRQNIRKLILENPSSPPPVHEGNPSLWHLADLLVWLRDDKGYSIKQPLIDLAEAAFEVNTAVWETRVEGRIADEVRDGVRALLA